MILVTAATGYFGKLVLEFLEKKISSREYMGMARNPNKAEELHAKKIEILKGDYFDYPSLVKNFRGVDKLFFISSGDVKERMKQHTNVIDAANEARVKHIFYTSFVNAKPDPYFTFTIDHFNTEELIKSSGFTYTIHRHAFYLDQLPDLIGDAIQTGKIYYPGGEGKFSPALRSDLAETAANILTGSGHENKTYELCMNRSYTFHDIAETLSKTTGKKIEYVNIPLEVMQQELLKKQVPQFAVDVISQIAEAVKHDELNNPNPLLKNILGREPFEIEEFVAKIYKK